MILKVEIVQAEYWDVDKRAMIRLWIMVRAEQKSCRRPITRSFRNLCEIEARLLLPGYSENDASKTNARSITASPR
jgi:hypothetical protein